MHAKFLGAYSAPDIRMHTHTANHRDTQPWIQISIAETERIGNKDNKV